MADPKKPGGDDERLDETELEQLNGGMRLPQPKPPPDPKMPGG